MSKFEIYDNFIISLNQLPIFNILFGNGMGNNYEILGIGAHNIIVLHVLDMGIIGTVLWLLVQISILWKTKFKGIIIVFPFLLASMSAFSHAYPYYYSILAIIYVLEKRKIQYANNYLPANFISS
jgi:hypothetical protein